MAYQTLIKAIATDPIRARGMDKLYFIFIYPCQYLENNLVVLYDGQNVSVFGIN